MNEKNRLSRAILASLAVNALGWSALGGALLGQKAPPPVPIEISRVILTPKGERIPKTVTKKQIARKIERIRREIVRRRPSTQAPRPRSIERPRRERPRRERPRSTRPIEPTRARPLQRAPEAPQSNRPAKPSAEPQPQGARNRTLIAKNAAAPGAGRVIPGGNAKLGQPIDRQNPGNARNNPTADFTPAPQPQPTEPVALPDPTTPPAADPTATPRTLPTATPLPTPTPRPIPTPTPLPTATPKPAPTPTPRPTPRPLPTPTPRPTGPTRAAIATRQVQPSVPEVLRNAEFKSSVRVRVEVASDGTPSPSLRGGSGNSEIDSRVLAALRRWKWKPALQNGEAVASTQYFRFDFEVR